MILAIPGDKVFELVDRYGLPLEIILEECKKEDLVIDISIFTKIALSKKWNKDRLFQKIQEAYTDIYNEQYATIIISRLKEIYA